MSDDIPPARNLDSLKKEAKRWLNALRTGDRMARTRLERILPSVPADPTLRDVQHALAREHGFPGWLALKQEVETGGGGNDRCPRTNARPLPGSR